MKHPPVQIRVPHDNRIKAIETLSQAVLAIAQSLAATTQVHITNATISNADIGIRVDSEQRDYQTDNG